MPVFAQCARLASCLLDVQAAVIALCTKAERTEIVASHGLTGETAAVASRLCRSFADPHDRAILSLGPEDAPLRSGASAAIRARDGTRVGTLFVLDSRPREFTSAELALLAELCDPAAEHLALRTEAIELRERLAALNATSSNAIIFHRRDGTVDGWNHGATELLGWTAEEVVNRVDALVPTGDVAEIVRRRELIYERGEVLDAFECKRLTRDGRLLDVVVNAGPVRDAEGEISGIVVIMQDRTALNRTREAERRRLQILELAANDAPLSEIFDHLVESVEFTIPEGICAILLCKGNALEHVASGPALPQLWIKAIGQARIGPSEGSCGAAAYFGQTIIVGDIATDPRWETPRPLALDLGLRACWSVPIFSARGLVHGTISVYSKRPRVPSSDELSAIQEAAQLASIAIEGQRTRDRLEDLALRDSLTGLPNRGVFESRLRHAIAAEKRPQERIFIGLLDLDRFKIVNDTLGHVVGDQLLIEVAQRLQHAVRPQDTVARMGGDEFLFLLTGVDSRDAAEGIARRILATLDGSFLLSGHEVFVHASFGFSVYPDDANEAVELLRLADRTMYEVKAAHTGVGFFAHRAGDNDGAELSLETALYRALERRELFLRYQPQVGRGNCLAAEAHLYWNHPELGVLDGERFMAIADGTGLSIPIGAWALDEACRVAKRWKAAGGPGRVAVNVSARQCNDHGFVAMVLDTIKRVGIAPAQLSLEISETVARRSYDGIAATLAELRSYGVRIVMDGFGTGSSTLAHLRRFPIDGLKIDRSFLVERSAGGEELGDRSIVELTVALGRALHVDVIADGVETPAQLGLVLESCCDVVQGSLLAPAMPEEALLRWSPSLHIETSMFDKWTTFNAERHAIDRIRTELERPLGSEPGARS